ncbi:MAG: ATP-binding protein [bacterium]
MYRIIEGKLKEWKLKKDRKPLLLSGARQVGKTYSLKKFGNESFIRLHYLNFEEDETLKKIFERDLKSKRILEEISFALDSSIDIKNDLIIFDEIQECPRAITSLKYFKENLPELAICCAGSLLGLHLGETNFPVGKVEFMPMHPMSFNEFLLGIGDKKASDFLTNFSKIEFIPEIIHSHLWEQFKIYLVIGGLPEIVKTYRDNINDKFKSFQMIGERQHNLILSYLADIAKHSGKQNSMHIERIWRNVPSQLSRTNDGSSPKFRFKGIVPGIKGYGRLSGAIDWLEKAGLIIKSNIVTSAHLPLSAYSKENFIKLFLFDVGILRALSHLAPKTILDYEYGSYKGYYAENFITQELKCMGIKDIVCWRENTSEVEFLITWQNLIIPLEIKSGWVTQAKSLKVFMEKYRPKIQIIMSARNISIDRDKKLYKLPIYLISATHLFEKLLHHTFTFAE